jgi:nucleoprotein TPR/epidermal growth factor receptor substrate 15
MEANFAREKLEGIMKESERKRKLRESSESLHAAEEISRKLSMEVVYHHPLSL